MKNIIDEKLELVIQEHGKSGREALNKGDLELAERFFLSCWDLIPEPKLAHGYAQIISSGMVKFFRDTHQVEKAKNWLEIMRAAYGSTESTPDLHVDFHAATVHFEAGEFEDAYRLFQPQYLAYGKRPFEGQDKKYLDFVLKRTTGK